MLSQTPCIPGVAPATPAPPVAARSCRVLCLIAAIALMSLADLYITLTFLRSVGMGEDNPLARWIMTNCSETFLVSWKLMTVVLACGILFGTRHTRPAELAAWTCCLILAWLTVRWGTYSDEVHAITPVLHHITQIDEAKWVRTGP